MIDLEDHDDFTERERWAYQEAKFCQRMAVSLREMIAGWLEGVADRGHHSSRYQNAYEVAVKAQAWEDLALHLMRSYYNRKEMEAYREAGLTP